MIKLIYSNKTERLLEELAGDLREWREGGGTHPLEPVELVVPNQNMETWVGLGLAQLTGVAANLRFSRLNRFIGGLVGKACPGELKLVDLDIVEAALLAVLMDDQFLESPALGPVKLYLQSSGTGGAEETLIGFDASLAPDGEDLRRVQLAARMAFLFQEYGFSRPEMIAAWRDDRPAGQMAGLFGASYADPAAIDPAAGSTVAWQCALWRAILGRGGLLEANPPEGGGRWVTMDQLPFEERLFENIGKIGLPPVYIFGISYMALIFQQLFSRLGEVIHLKIYNLNPCAEFWQDVESPRGYHLRVKEELLRRERLSPEESEDPDPFGLYARDNPALLYWGRPGGEHLRYLGDLTGHDFLDAFEDPTDRGGGLLQQLQLDILNRTPEGDLGRDLDAAGIYCTPSEDSAMTGDTAGEGDIPAPGSKVVPGAGQADDTIRVIAAPSARREVEWVADEIWRLMREDHGPPGEGPLRLSDLAIIVNGAEQDLYLPLIQAVFAACHDLPCTISDLPAGSGSRLVEAMNLLLKFPFGRFTRSEVLTLMGHPSLIGNLGDLAAEDLAALADRLGIIFGGDHRDHLGTYIEEDIFNWDQGIRRLALGAFMTGEKSGEKRIFETSAGRWLVEESYAHGTAAAARFGLLARSLLADARFVRGQKMTLEKWAEFYYSQMETYLITGSGTDDGERLLMRAALGRLETMDLGQPVSGRAAAEIALRTLESLIGSRGHYLTEGVTVSTFLPMRAIPFRVVFLLGLGEGLFPASGQRDALDLRAVKRRVGDVDPSERDRYMFLETLLCTREKLYLSYVARDEHTGDPRQPSAVVQELLHILKTGYLGREGIKLLSVDPPLQLRRYDEALDRLDTFFDEARVEAQVQGIAREWKNLGRPEKSEKAADVLARIRQELDKTHWEALSELLALPGKPPAAAAVTAAAGPACSMGKGKQEAPVSISIPVLRRFLECPLQGWASAQLGLTEVEDDLIDREEEDFEINRLTENRLLTGLFFDVASGNYPDLEALYNERLLRLHLSGKIPAGDLGQALRGRHLSILEGWLSRLSELAGRKAGQGGSAGPPDLFRIRLGHSSRKDSAELVCDPLLLEVPCTGPENTERIVQVRISGLTEGLLDNRLIAISPVIRKAPRAGYTKDTIANFRYFLRGAITLAILAATGQAGHSERQALALYADGKNDPGELRFRLRPPDPGKARAWLSALAADLLSGHHAYLLPCEAVYQEFSERGRGSRADGDRLRELIREASENEWAWFSSLWGPVPQPRLYDPPAAGEAARMVERRFEPLFAEILEGEL